ncbi:unnamed protein product [Prorocentrum cordatum]|uniref:Uncharacterized protein n=1 Tax=Prorocentrum cordatum TaxID=2364126 RepID=A0ABN9TB73_9DINO|nr:unnamed protein product [Polarella glacialis]
MQEALGMSAPWPVARGLLALAVPVFPAGSQVPFGPVPLLDVLLSLAVATVLCSAAGHHLTRSGLLLSLRGLLPHHAELRDEAVEEEAHLAAVREPLGDDASADGTGGGKARPAGPRKRTVAELLFIVVHNAAVAMLSPDGQRAAPRDAAARPLVEARARDPRPPHRLPCQYAYCVPRRPGWIFGSSAT